MSDPSSCRACALIGDCQILLIEDQADHARAVLSRIAHELRDRDIVHEVQHVRTLAEALRLLKTRRFDVAILDLELPDGVGLANVQRLAVAEPGLPVVVLTSHDDLDDGVRAVQLGAQDYLVKGSVGSHSLCKSLRFAIERHGMVRQIEYSRVQENGIRDRFLSHVSHELRTPLSAIMQFVGIVRDGVAGPVTNDQKNALGIVTRNIGELRRMIGSLMETTRVAGTDLECHLERERPQVLLEEGLEGLLDEAEQAGLSLTVAAPSELPELIADRHRFKQLIGNLVGNAIKFTPSGGRIEVHVERPARLGGDVVFSVSDTGCGIPEADQERIFERMVQLDAPTDVGRVGLGLGLYISREIVKRHHGRMWVETRDGGGSVFRFTIPSYDLYRLVESSLAHLTESDSPAAGDPRPGVDAPVSIALVRLAVSAPTATSRAVGVGRILGDVGRSLLEVIEPLRGRLLPTRRVAADRGSVFGLVACRPDEIAAIEDAMRRRIEEQPHWARWGFRIAVGGSDLIAPDLEQLAWLVGEQVRQFDSGIAPDSSRDPGSPAIIQPVAAGLGLRAPIRGRSTTRVR